MTEHHPLAPLRRWLVEPGSPQKVVAALLVVLMVITVTLVALHNGPLADQESTVDLENSVSSL